MVGIEHHYLLLAGLEHTHTILFEFSNISSGFRGIFSWIPGLPMLKNCSACNSRHTAPFGKFCKHLVPEYCDFCKCVHDQPAGQNCPARRAQLFIALPQTVPPVLPETMSVPISDAFKDRSDPEYLIYLEEQVKSLQTSKKDSSDISYIVQRLEALELAQQRRDAGTTPGGGGSHAGATAGGTQPYPPVAGLSAGLRSADPHFPNSGAVGGAVGGEVGGGVPGGNNPPVDPSLLPLTDALAQLTLAVDPAAGKAKGLFLRPEYHVQHVKASTPLKQLDHTKMSYKDLVYGWFCVLQHVIAKGGDVNAYVAHCKFVSEQATSGSFVDAAFVNYDRHVVGKVVDNPTSTFVAGDMLGVASHFNAANLAINNAAVTTKKAGQRYKFFPKKAGQSTDHRDKSASDSNTMPDGFPDDICYSYNYRTCTGRCSKKHVCRICKADHQAKQCTKRE